jgi:hypothetical protein
VSGMREGDELLTAGGAQTVRSIVRLEMSPETQLHNLVLSGSHTYNVNRYWVTGWPREDDYDFDAWAPRALAFA